VKEAEKENGTSLLEVWVPLFYTYISATKFGPLWRVCFFLCLLPRKNPKEQKKILFQDTIQFRQQKHREVSGWYVQLSVLSITERERERDSGKAVNSKP
jgi:hypothetical protein